MELLSKVVGASVDPLECVLCINGVRYEVLILTDDRLCAGCNSNESRARQILEQAAKDIENNYSTVYADCDDSQMHLTQDSSRVSFDIEREENCSITTELPYEFQWEEEFYSRPHIHPAVRCSQTDSNEIVSYDASSQCYSLTADVFSEISFTNTAVHEFDTYEIPSYSAQITGLKRENHSANIGNMNSPYCTNAPSTQIHRKFSNFTQSSPQNNASSISNYSLQQSGPQQVNSSNASMSQTIGFNSQCEKQAYMQYQPNVFSTPNRTPQSTGQQQSYFLKAHLNQPTKQNSPSPPLQSQQNAFSTSSFSLQGSRADISMTNTSQTSDFSSQYPEQTPQSSCLQPNSYSNTPISLSIDLSSSCPAISQSQYATNTYSTSNQSQQTLRSNENSFDFKSPCCKQLPKQNQSNAYSAGKSFSHRGNTQQSRFSVSTMTQTSDMNSPHCDQSPIQFQQVSSTQTPTQPMQSCKKQQTSYSRNSEKITSNTPCHGEATNQLYLNSLSMRNGQQRECAPQSESLSNQYVPKNSFPTQSRAVPQQSNFFSPQIASVNSPCEQKSSVRLDSKLFSTPIRARQSTGHNESKDVNLLCQVGNAVQLQGNAFLFSTNPLPAAVQQQGCSFTAPLCQKIEFVSPMQFGSNAVSASAANTEQQMYEIQLTLKPLFKTAGKNNGTSDLMARWQS